MLPQTGRQANATDCGTFCSGYVRVARSLVGRAKPACAWCLFI